LTWQPLRRIEGIKYGLVEPHIEIQSRDITGMLAFFPFFLSQRHRSAMSIPPCSPPIISDIIQPLHELLIQPLHIHPSDALSSCPPPSSEPFLKSKIAIKHPSPSLSSPIAYNTPPPPPSSISGAGARKLIGAAVASATFLRMRVELVVSGSTFVGTVTIGPGSATATPRRLQNKTARKEARALDLDGRIVR